MMGPITSVRRRRACVAAAVAALLVAPLVGTGTVAAAPPPSGVTVAPSTVVVDPGGAGLNSFDARLLALVNDARARLGRPPLRAVPGLTGVASGIAQRNAAGRALQHDARLAASATAAGCRWSALGEVIAFVGSSDPRPETVLEMYRRSAAHWPVLMDPRYTVAGIATVDRADRRYGRFEYNTIKVADSCGSGARTATPPWGLFVERIRPARGTTTTIADLTGAADPRVASASWGGARGIAAVSSPSPAGVRVRLSLRSASATGYAGLLLRQGVETFRAPVMRVRLSAVTPTRAALPVVIRAWDGFGTPVVVGVVRAGAEPRTWRLPLPRTARGFVNHVTVGVPAAALRTQGSTATRWRATLTISSVAVSG